MLGSGCDIYLNYIAYFCAMMSAKHLLIILFSWLGWSKADKQRYDWGQDIIMKDKRLKNILQQDHDTRDDVYRGTRWFDARVGMVVWLLLGVFFSLASRFGLLCG